MDVCFYIVLILSYFLEFLNQWYAKLEIRGEHTANDFIGSNAEATKEKLQE